MVFYPLQGRKSNVKIHEDAEGGIYVVGVTTRLVHSLEEVSCSEYIWATSWENLFKPYANNKGADQPAHPRSLISTFVVRYLIYM